ncbi:hypothetical protein D3C87_2013350 [compost metagenome]
MRQVSVSRRSINCPVDLFVPSRCAGVTAEMLATSGCRADVEKIRRTSSERSASLVDATRHLARSSE